MDAVSIGNALASGSVTSTELVDIYTERIHTMDRSGANINSIRVLNPNARTAAASLDHERSLGYNRGPLHGLPFVVKDNFDVLGLSTTAGSAALAGSYPARNAAVVRNLIDAGAFVLGTTNMSELAASAGMYGYSSIAGWTRNPYNLDHTVYGSSSGTAAAVASRFAAFGLGTDTSGSIRAPASAAGLVGIRPTTGTVSLEGIMPHARSLDMPGPITVSGRDAALVLSIMTTDRATLRPQDCPRSLHRCRWDRTAVGVLQDYFGVDPEIDDAVSHAVRSMIALGARVVDVELPPALNHLADNVVRPLSNYEFKFDIESYLSTLKSSPISSLSGLIAAIESSTSSPYPVNPRRLQGLRDAERVGSSRSSKELRRHLLDRKIPYLRHTLQQVFAQNGLNVLVFPTVTRTAPQALLGEDHAHHSASENPYLPTYLGSATGHPEVTCPVGADSQNIPIGISLLGLPDTDHELLDLASSLTAEMPVAERPRTVL